ncbi:hypothetical protein [Arenibaculum pallidiluteum]|uniref:hypothetical protein n=1 Tax=Arenibaculum pallidiluteum TaxID=2812559 RepID=UPI001A96F4CB|nr:hypothetical protein [Arenibaculum pallidiluteum]
MNATSPADRELSNALDAASDEARIRERALTLAVNHYRKINFTGDPARIVKTAEAFADFLRARA